MNPVPPDYATADFDILASILDNNVVFWPLPIDISNRIALLFTNVNDFCGGNPTAFCILTELFPQIMQNTTDIVGRQLIKNLLFRSIWHSFVDGAYSPYLYSLSFPQLFNIFASFCERIPNRRVEIWGDIGRGPGIFEVDYYTGDFNFHRLHGPAIATYDYHCIQLEALYLIATTTQLDHYFKYGASSIFHRPIDEGPAAIFKILGKTILVKFYAVNNIITNVPEKPAIIIQKEDGQIINIYVVNGYATKITYSIGDCASIEFMPNSGEQLIGTKFYDCITKGVKYSANIITSVIGIIDWRDGAVSVWFNAEEFVTTLADKSKEWRKLDVPIPTDRMIPLSRDIGVLHRVQFALDETETNVLQPAKIDSSGKVVEYWVATSSIKLDIS